MNASEDQPSELRESSLPPDIPIRVRGYDQDLTGLDLAFRRWLEEIGRFIDLGGLDGLTIAGDYSQALLDLDRGFSTDYKLAPTQNEFGVGVAMTPSVIRDGAVKSHIILGPAFLELVHSKERPMVWHLLTHECAHVQVTSAYDRRFPGVLLRKRATNIRESICWSIAHTCWNEYAACRVSAPWGHIQLSSYEDTLRRCASEARPSANEFIKKYRLHHDVDLLLRQVDGTYGDLLKYAAYWLGTLHGIGGEAEEADVLKDHWFNPYLVQLSRHLSGWFTAGVPGDAALSAVGDLVEQVLHSGGIEFQQQRDGDIHVNIPFTPETLP